MQIFHLRHNEIDKDKWNNTLLLANNVLPYPCAWYLDVVSPEWEALVTAEYDYIMPVPIKRKLGIKFVVQPPLCQQLGIFSALPPSKQIILDFINAIPYPFYLLSLNANNTFDVANAKKRNNFILKLKKPYLEIRNNYSNNFIRNIKKAENSNLHVYFNTTSDAFFDFANAESKMPAKSLLFLKKLADNIDNENYCICCACDDHNIIIAAVFFILWQNTAYYIFPVSSPAGFKKQAMSYLLDKFIQQNCSLLDALDFEGSSIVNIARFYKNTGAVNNPFWEIKKPKMLFNVIDALKHYF